MSLDPLEDRLEPADDLGWRKLSPRKMLLDPLKALGSAVVPVAIAVVTVNDRVLTLVTIGVTLLFAVVGGVYPYLTTRYRFTATHFEVRTGWLNKKVSTAALIRIRAVDLEASLLYRVTGMQKISIGTGVDGDSVTLDALPHAEAHALRELLLSRRSQAPAPGSDSASGDLVAPAPGVAPADAPVQPLAAYDPRWAKYAPLHLTGLVLLLVGVGGLVQFTLSLPGVDVSVLDGLARWTQTAAVVGTGLVLLGIACVVWLAVSVLAWLTEWHDYRLWRQAGTLHLTRGLLTVRSDSLEERRVRGLVLAQPLLVRLAGGADLRVLSSGSGARTAAVSPTVPRPVAVQVGAHVLTTAEPLLVDAARHPVAALRRRLWRGAVPAVVVLAAGLLVTGDHLPGAWGAWLHERVSGAAVALAVPVVLAWGLAAGWSAYRHLGHTVTSAHLVSTGGVFSLVREVLEVDGIIGWVVRQSVFQRRLGLVTLVATTAAGSEKVIIPDVAIARAHAVMAACTPHVVAPFLEPPGA